MVIICLMILLPIFAVAVLALFPTENIWPQLISTSLPRYLTNSVKLMVLVGVVATLFGVTTAWIVSRYTFPMRSVFQWALFLPLAVPSYIGAYAFVDFWEYAGPFQTKMRALFGWETARDYWFFETRSLGTAVFVIALSLYPYIYMLARSAFRDQSDRVMEVARALGAKPVTRFWQIALPMARPAIAVGAAIVMMETLNDFGAVDYFAVQTLTTGIFTIWLETNNLGGASQIALVLIGLIATLLMLERYSRRNIRVDKKSNRDGAAGLQKLGFGKSILAITICTIPVLFGFIMPVSIMLSHAVRLESFLELKDFVEAAYHSIWVAGFAGILTISAAMIVIFAIQILPNEWRRVLAQISMLGYAVPGAVLAIGVLIPLAWFDHRLADFVQSVFNVDIGLVFTGSAAAIILAYFVRFFALGIGTIGSAMGRQSPNLLASARALGAAPNKALRQVHVPLIRGPIIVALLLVFVDGVKELPATLLLRPFGFETLSTLIYNSASREDIEGASIASLAVICVSVIAVLVVARATKR